MGKIINLIIICLYFSAEVVSQSPSIEWQKLYGGFGTDQFNSIIGIYNNGYLISGGTNSISGNVNNNHNGSWDPWIIRTDSLGNILLNNCFGGSADDILASQVFFPNGNILFCGFTQSNDGDVSGNHNPGTNDGWLVLVDSSLNIVRQKCIGGSGYDSFTNIKLTSDSDYIVVGTSNSADGDLSGINGHGNYDLWVLKLDSNWDIQWQKRYGGSDEDVGWFSFKVSDGYLIGGHSKSNDGDVVGFYGGSDYWLIKIDTIGDLIWAKCYGGSGNEYLNGMVADANENFYLSGQSSSHDGMISATNDTVANGSDFWIVKIDSSGNFEWEKSFGGVNIEIPYTTRIYNNEILMTGITTSDNGDITNMHDACPLCADAWIVAIDTSGNLIWQSCYGGSDGDEGSDCIKTNDGGYLLIGDSESRDDDLTGSNNQGNSDAWITKLNFFTLDAALSFILSPTTIPLCDNTFIPKVLIKNNAITPITSMDIKYQLDAGAIQTISWNGNLMKDSTELITFPSQFANAGNHSLKVYVTNPNGNTDQNPLNDTLVCNFIIDQSFATIPFHEGFQDTLFPPLKWSFDDPYNLFYHMTTAGGFGNSDSCLRLKLFSVSGLVFADLFFPEIDFSGLVAPVSLTFSLASAMMNQFSLQSLTVFASTDCASTWTQVYQKDDTALATTGFHGGNFIPIPTDWRIENIDLSSYVGQQHLRLGFEIQGQNTNNMHFDDINLNDATSSVLTISSRPSFLSCYFTSSNILQVSYYATKNEIAKLILLDNTGRLILQQSFVLKEGLNTQFVNTGVLSAGFYFLRVESLSKSMTEKVIRN